MQTPFEKKRARFNATMDQELQRKEQAANQRYRDTLARITAQYQDPTHLAELARKEQKRMRDREDQRIYHYQRQLERLSGRHVRNIRQYCARDLMPLCPGPELLVELIASWDWISSVFFVGPTGSGKTLAMTWVAMQWACDGGTVRRTTAPRVCRATAEHIDDLRRCGLLLLDQMHLLDGMPDWQVGPVVDLVDYRHEAEDTTLAAGTASPEEMGGIIGQEVRRRFPTRYATDEVWDPDVMGNWPFPEEEA